MFMTKNRQMLRDLKQELEHLKDVLIVMDPKVSTSADAYEGLRKQVAVAASSRRSHLVQLAQFSQALDHDAKADDLTSLVTQWMQQAGLAAFTDPTPDVYEILEGDAGTGQLEVISPAYVDSQTGALVSLGQGRWVPRTDEAPAESVTTALNDTTEEALA